MGFDFKSFLGIKPSNLKRRLILGSVFIFLGGFITFATVFYSFILSIQTTMALCVFPSESAAGIMASFLGAPIILIGIYIGLSTAIIYYVNPWEKIKR